MNHKTRNVIIASLGAAALASVSLYVGANTGKSSDPIRVTLPAAPDSVTLGADQTKAVKLTAAQPYTFAASRPAFGYIDFNQDSTVQVFSPWPGRVTRVVAKAGDDVASGQLLFAIQSPDLVQAESNLIATAGLLELANKSLQRVKSMLEIKAAAQRDLEQAVSDQQTAEGNHMAARDAVRIFGKSEQEMNRIIKTRRVDGELLITSPLNGRVTARNLSPGVLVQPGSANAPFTVANLSTMWMVANVPEADLRLLQLGQPVKVSVVAYPDRTFEGKVANIGAAVDPVTHSIAVRSEVSDPGHLLRPQMLANFVIRTGEPTPSVAIPQNGVVREGDGTQTVFVSTDGHHFTRRPVKLGMDQDGLVQVLEGVNAGETVATDGALFLSNALALQSR